MRMSAFSKGLGAGAAIGTLSGWLVRRRAANPAAATATGDTGSSPPDGASAPDSGRPPGDGDGAEPSRARDPLVRHCIDIADLIREPYPDLWDRLTDHLADVGVQTVLADGERFDVERHDAVDRAPTDDPDQDRTIASTRFAGYRVGEEWIRRPQVVVYRATAGRER